MARLFGTDGIRGLANGEVLTPELALAVARSAAVQLLDSWTGPGRPTAVIGRDTRPSGGLLEAAAAAGFASAGVDVVLLGVVPTPTVAHACASRAADVGLVISASHNPMPDNGLKLFDGEGHKLSDAVEDAIAAGVPGVPVRAQGIDVGQVRAGGESLVEDYAQHLLASVSGPLTGLTVVVDCAEGAASALAPSVYRRAGATVVALHADGDGARINAACGATHPESLQAAVVAHGADLGLAHDGDADRCVAVDASGRVVDGDQILAVCALALRDRDGLGSGAVVATVMSNVGFHQAMAAAGIGVVTTAVGDRYVLEAMRAGGHSLGGEQSGHLVFGDLATTGDGLLTGLALMDRMVTTGAPLAELAGAVVLLPQVLVNVRAEGARAGAADVVAAVTAAEAHLAGRGRVLLRASGTEPVVRVMVEAPTQEEAQEVAGRLASVVGQVREEPLA
ncbi:MAG: phosphoglucosamine mutase [Actinomycetota bacterium]|nr:phosphoglucosamine mutase [Actinomycetota bacterium]